MYILHFFCFLCVPFIFFPCFLFFVGPPFLSRPSPFRPSRSRYAIVLPGLACWDACWIQRVAGDVQVARDWENSLALTVKQL